MYVTALIEGEITDKIEVTKTMRSRNARNEFEIETDDHSRGNNQCL